ncbi:major facilitator superfamily domain-containing protein [Aspergillus egyptiacus]|nr:major facilitator superfamily domain-containing protein [Aspergillus egyptiacus]
MEDRTPPNQPPGTVKIAAGHGQRAAIVLEPTPTTDPNDPLHSISPSPTSTTLSTFVLLSISPVIWAPLNSEIGITWANLNNTFAANLTGLAVGCLIFIPFAIKYGRRSIYIASVTVQLAVAIWQAKLNTTWEVLATSAISGLAGAVSEALVQMTIVDLFFVHQRASANAVYHLVVNVGAHVAPVAAGYCATKQGWRWIWWWTAVMLALTTVLFLFGLEEKKYIPVGQQLDLESEAQSTAKHERDVVPTLGSECYRLNSYRQRLRFITKTDHSLWENMYRPVRVLLTFPAVIFASLVWGCFLSWFSIISTTQSTYLPVPPYWYTPAQVGLFSLPPFIGGILGAVLSGPLNDRYIVWRAKRKQGIFEPETRLHMALPVLAATPAGLLLFGIGLSRGWPWWSLALGSSIFGFSMFCNGVCALTYLADCYQEILGDALVGVAFVRNGLATAFVFALTPWIEATGLENMFISVAWIAMALQLTIIPMIIWGKTMRGWTAARYRQMVQQPGGSRIVTE